jgi:Amt family ammonium transporter
VNPAGADGLFYGGGFKQLGIQTLAALVVLVYSFVLTAIIGYAIKKAGGFRVSTEHEVSGIDEGQHAESAYDFTGMGGLGHTPAFPVKSATKLQESKA